MKRLFISYAHVDKWQVKTLAEILSSANFDPWYDHRLGAGSDWKAQLDTGIRECDGFIYALSPESVKSEWCQWELQQATQIGKAIVPILLQANTKIPDAIKNFQYADFSEGPTSINVAKLIADIQTAIANPPSPKLRVTAPLNPSGIPGRAMNQHVFISYSKQNREFARSTATSLRNNGFNVWIDDEIQYGDDWWDVIEQAVRDCGAFIVIMSPESKKSTWVTREILVGERNQKPIFPILFRGEDWSRFYNIQYFDARDGGSPDERFLQTIEKYVPRTNQGQNVTPDLKQAAELVRQQASINTVFVSFVDEDKPVQAYLTALRNTIGKAFNGVWIVKDSSGINDYEEIAKQIRQSKLHISFVGALYGQRTELDERSRTHFEYDVAKDFEIPSITVLLSDQLPEGMSASQLLKLMPEMEKQQAFRSSVEQDKRSTLVKASDIASFVGTMEKQLEHLRPNIESKTVEKSSENVSKRTEPTIADNKPKHYFFSDEEDHNIYGLDERTLFREIYKLSTLDEELLQFMLEQPLARESIGGGRYERLDLAAQLERLGLMRHGMILYGTFLCFANPQFLRGHLGGLQLVIYDNSKRGATNNTSLQLAQTNLLRQFDAGMDFLERGAGLQRAGGIGTSRRDELEIPQIAMREALANAIVHRTYSMELRHDPSRIEVYPDRIDFTSFGGFVQNINLDKLNDNPEAVKSRRRNPIIAKIFQYMAHVELNASGVSRMFKLVEEFGLKRPEILYSEAENAVTVTFYRRSQEEVVEEEIKRLRAFIASNDLERIETAIKNAEDAANNTPDFAERFIWVADMLKAQRAFLTGERLIQSDKLEEAEQALLISLPLNADDDLRERIEISRQKVLMELERRTFVKNNFDDAEKALQDANTATVFKILAELENAVVRPDEQRQLASLTTRAKNLRFEEIAKAINGINIADVEHIKQVPSLYSMLEELDKKRASELKSAANFFALVLQAHESKDKKASLKLWQQAAKDATGSDLQYIQERIKTLTEPETAQELRNWIADLKISDSIDANQLQNYFGKLQKLDKKTALTLQGRVELLMDVAKAQSSQDTFMIKSIWLNIYGRTRGEEQAYAQTMLQDTNYSVSSKPSVAARNTSPQAKKPSTSSKAAPQKMPVTQARPQAEEQSNGGFIFSLASAIALPSIATSSMNALGAFDDLFLSGISYGVVFALAIGLFLMNYSKLSMPGLTLLVLGITGFVAGAIVNSVLTSVIFLIVAISIYVIGRQANG